LKPGQHDYYSLATHAVAWFTVPVDIDGSVIIQAGQYDQRAAGAAWRRLQQEFSFLRDHLLDSALVKFVAEKVIPYAMSIFNGVFFLDSFRPRENRKHKLELLEMAAESTTKSLIQPEGDLIVIRLNPYHPYHMISSNQSLNSITLLHTLLQELINAFFDLYGCFKGTTCGTAECRFVSRQNIGKGRGRAWQMLAKAIEDEAPRLLPGFTPRLERRGMMVSESLQGGYTPSTCDLSHVCGDLELLARVLQKVRTRDDDDKMIVAVHMWAARDTSMPQCDLRRTKSEVLCRDDIDV
jgi:hypothetical protein